MDSRPTNGELVEVFRADTFLLADKIARVVLNAEGLEASVIDRTDHELPGVGQPGGYFVVVDAVQRERAVGLIEEARTNGLITE
jgi:hypothetical protein